MTNLSQGSLFRKDIEGVLLPLPGSKAVYICVNAHMVPV